MPLNRTSAGTITKPPPTPNKPDRTPVTIPTAANNHAHREVSSRLPLISRRQAGPSTSAASAEQATGNPVIAVSDALLHIRSATTSISMANSASNTVSEIRPDNHAPTGAPSIPATANTNPVRISTFRARQRPRKPTNDVTPTAASEIPTASRGATPRPYTSNGTAKIAPPPPVRPSEKPTIPPNSKVSSQDIFISTGKWSHGRSYQRCPDLRFVRHAEPACMRRSFRYALRTVAEPSG